MNSEGKLKTMVTNKVHKNWMAREHRAHMK